eukprot:s896_g5.t1
MVIQTNGSHTDAPRKSPPSLEGLKRSQALWHQKGWVAFDEMSFYLATIQISGTAVTTKPLDLRAETENPRILAEWILDAIEATRDEATTTLMTGCLFDEHWFPLKLDLAQETFSITTTHDMTDHVSRWIQHELLEEYQHAQGTNMPSAFDNDCGFQTIAWIINQSLDPDSNRPLSPAEAESWRKNFAHHLVLTEMHDCLVSDLPLGGTNDQHMTALQNLLEQHGVNRNRSMQAAQSLTQKLGAEVIQRTLQSPKPWQDLKARASQLKPPIRIVLSEELQASIDSKIASGQAIGRKQHKAKHQKQPEPQRLIAEQVQIPGTIFQQADGTLLQQILPSQFKAQCKGISCVSIDDAIPFLQLKAPLTQEGLGLIVIDHDDPRLPPQHEIVRFPATCMATSEPMLLTGALFQLGQKRVHRVAPQSASKIEEVETKVIRALIFKDQTKMAWKDIIEKPVRSLFAESEFTANPEAVVDVWDRQYVSKNYKKCKPDEAEIFIVTFRTKCPAHDIILDSSGQAGKYYEPRDHTGRTPDASYKVIWMPRKSFQDVMLAKQTSSHPTWIVGSGDRFGLRTLCDHAKAIHEQHRPELDYLEGEQMQVYRVGPLPWGTTKTSLQKLYKEWGWVARPGQPLGQSIGQEGAPSASSDSLGLIELICLSCGARVSRAMGRLKRGPGRWLRGVSLLQIGLGLALVLNQRHFAPNSTNSFAGVSVVRAQVRVQRAAGPEKGSEAGAWEAMSQSAAELMEDTSEFFVETLKAAFADRDGEETAENESAIAAVAAVKRSLDDLPEQTLATLQEVAMNQSESVSYLLDQAKSLSVKPSEFVEALGLVGRSSAEVEDKA